MADVNPFPQDALEKNRSGQLAESQYLWLRGMSKDSRRSNLSLAFVAAAIGLVLFFAPGPASAALTKPLVAAVLLLVAAFFFLRGMSGGDALTRDLRSGYVETVEGALLKHRIEGSGEASAPSYYFQVGGKQLHVSRAQYEWAPEAGWVRLFYLPNSNRVVNFERLPDRPLPPGALDSPQTAVKAAVRGFTSLDPNARAEARAELASIGDAMKAKVEAAQVPASGERDPRPLAEAIIGTWGNGLITIIFGADGTASAVLPGNNQRSGKWSVDGDGRLVSDATGHSEAADAYVAGGQLTITTGGASMTFSRSE